MSVQAAPQHEEPSGQIRGLSVIIETSCSIKKPTLAAGIWLTRRAKKNSRANGEKRIQKLTKKKVVGT